MAGSFDFVRVLVHAYLTTMVAVATLTGVSLSAGQRIYTSMYFGVCKYVYLKKPVDR